MRYWRTPLDAHQIKIPKGEIHLVIDRCKGCEFCVEYCPRGVLAMSKEFNVKGYHYPEVVEPENCVDCDLCEMICPDFAIFCVPAPEEAAAEATSEAAPEAQGDVAHEDDPTQEEMRHASS